MGRSLTPACLICSARPSSDDAGGLGELRFALLHLAVGGNVLGLVAIRDNEEGIPGIGNAFEAQNFNWRGWASFLDGASAVVEHGADLAEGVAHNKAVLIAQRSVLHQHRSDSTAAAVKFGFDDRTDGGSSRCGFEISKVGDQADHFQQQIKVLLLFRRDVDEYCRAAPGFRDKAAIAQLLLHAIRLRIGLVDLVHGHDDRHVGRLGVVDGFEGLRHHAIVGGDDYYDDIGDLGSARAHAGEGFVTRRIEEDNLAAKGRRIRLADADLVSADVLGNASGFAAGYIGLADGV